MKDALPIEHELAAERANALAVTAEKLERALAALDEAGRAVEAAPEAERDELVARHRKLRAQAAERLWFLIVQREAIGLTQHEAVLAFYRVPPELRRHVSPPPRPPRR